MNRTTVDEAAAMLQRQLPLGSANTLAFHDVSGPFIRVLVDPRHWTLDIAVPAVFEGFRVQVEKRGATFPLH